MKYYIVDPDNGETIHVPEYMSDGILKQYLDRKYTFAVATGAFLVGFFSGLIACLTR